MELYIQDIKEWAEWCEAKYRFNKSQTVELAASLTKSNINSVWDWVSGRRNTSKACMMLLSAYAKYADNPEENPFTWIVPPKSEKS